MQVGGTFNIDEPGACSFANEQAMTAVQIQYPDGDENKTGWGVASFEARDTAIACWKALRVPIYVHAPFNINPCDPVKGGWHRIRYMRAIEFAERLGAAGVVLHAGSRKERSEAEAHETLLTFLSKIASKTLMTTLVEVDAGSKAGTRIGSPAFLANVVRDLDSTRVRICLDTAHLYGRGIDVWDTLTRELLLEQLAGKIGLVHLNVPEPEVKLGGFLDRHRKATFRSFPKASAGMIHSFVTRFPCILECNREAQIENMQAIKLTIPDGQGIFG